VLQTPKSHAAISFFRGSNRARMERFSESHTSESAWELLHEPLRIHHLGSRSLSAETRLDRPEMVVSRSSERLAVRQRLGAFDGRPVLERNRPSTGTAQRKCSSSPERCEYLAKCVVDQDADRPIRVDGSPQDTQRSIFAHRSRPDRPDYFSRAIK
jgi:hypothetical protein